MPPSSALTAYAAWLAAWSAVTFLAYGLDKWRATRNRGGGRRIPEHRLHALALVGGAVGGWLGMRLFRHKRRKPRVRVVLAIATAIQLAVAIGLWRLG